MEKREKVELILEQMRLCLAKQDYIRTQIISKKINTKFFEDEGKCDHFKIARLLLYLKIFQYYLLGTQDLKLKYYRLMMEVDQHEGSYLATCKHYRAVLNTPSVMAVPEERQAAAQAVVLYLILAPHNNEQVHVIFLRNEYQNYFFHDRFLFSGRLNSPSISRQNFGRDPTLQATSEAVHHSGINKVVGVVRIVRERTERHTRILRERSGCEKVDRSKVSINYFFYN